MSSDSEQHDWTPYVDEALGMVDGLSQRSAGKRLGVSGTTIGQWRGARKKGKKIYEVKGNPRAVLLRIAEENARSDAEPSAPDNSDDLRRRLNAIDASALDDLSKVLARDSLAAVYLAHAIMEAEAAARERAIATQRAYQASAARATIVAAHDERVPSHLIEGYELPRGEDGAGEREEQTGQEADD